MSLFTFDPGAERIALAHRRLSDIYHRRPGAQIAVVEPSVRGPVPGCRMTEQLDDLEKMLVEAVSWANGLASTDNDWPPMLNTLCGVVQVAEILGCPVSFGDDGVAWTQPAISDIAQVWTLKPLKSREAPLTKRLAEFIDYAQRTVGTEVPFWTMDIQSPFSVAAHILDGCDLLCACITDPEAVHYLCQLITTITIDTMQEHIAQMENPGFPGRNFPSISEPVGICIADDTPLIMLSPAMYEEFALPYNCQLGEFFGGVHIHSCGGYMHNLDNLLKITNIRSIQLHAGPGEFDLPETAAVDHPFNRARDRVAMLVDANVVSYGDVYRGRAKDHYSDYVLAAVAQWPPPVPDAANAGHLPGSLRRRCRPALDTRADGGAGAASEIAPGVPDSLSPSSAR